MQILFAISILCFLAIAWAAISFARHIKATTFRVSEHQSAAIIPAKSDFQHHLYAAASAESLRPRHSDLHQNVRDITANKSWNLPPKAVQTKRLGHLPRVEPVQQQQIARKPPKPARHGEVALLDPAYFNKDSGDLTDPYQSPRVRANDGNRTISSRRY
jgi:hypothetical protein